MCLTHTLDFWDGYRDTTCGRSITQPPLHNLKMMWENLTLLNRAARWVVPKHNYRRISLEETPSTSCLSHFIPWVEPARWGAQIDSRLICVPNLAAIDVNLFSHASRDTVGLWNEQLMAFSSSLVLLETMLNGLELCDLGFVVSTSSCKAHTCTTPALQSTKC